MGNEEPVAVHQLRENDPRLTSGSVTLRDPRDSRSFVPWITVRWQILVS